MGMYDHIIGLTGTLKHLASGMKDVLSNEFGVHSYTHMPSAYGEKKIEFHPYEPGYVRVHNEEEFFEELHTLVEKERGNGSI
mmetsp:Transcript_32209/g.83689  ORF Transcript_32209/g.83689 Transcript_32209/m.83689 type:complete len:82 (-) Transcript_32209:489-734(-)